MSDPRIQKMAQVLTHYSLALKPGDRFRLRGPVVALPLMREVFREAVQLGAHVFYRINERDFTEILLKDGTTEQLQFADHLLQEIDLVDADLNIWSETNTRQFSQIDPQRMALMQRANGAVSGRFMQRFLAGKLRWCGSLYPTEAHAQDAHMSLSDYEDFVYSACLLDEADPIAAWQRVHSSQQRIVEFLNTCRHIRIVAPGTELEYRCAGRTWINCDGKVNFPDGEVFTGPIEDSVNGQIHFTYPSVYNGREAQDVRLTFKDGKVVEATAASGQAFLDAMLDMDDGARFVGEAAFGLNPAIRNFTRNILFDEKIGGTMHLALGAANPETGSRNRSSLHWDMVCDLRQGEVYADGELCYSEGQFII
jgi:aminopeptidase